MPCLHSEIVAIHPVYGDLRHPWPFQCKQPVFLTSSNNLKDPEYFSDAQYAFGGCEMPGLNAEIVET